jgi:putative protease
MYQLLKYLAALGPDGLIVQDFGVITMVREHFPSLKLHASTQMNIASARGVNVLSKYGFSRVVLARELNLEEIRHVRQNTNMELEVFVHGALCVSESGICLFSSYLGGKSANRGMCTQACRRLYRREAENGYYFSPNDMQLLELIPDLVDAGVNSFKIEGRMKSAEYVGTVVSAYRRVIDALAEQGSVPGGGVQDEGREAGGAENSSGVYRSPSVKKAVQEGLDILRNDFARSKTLFYMEKEIDWLNPGQNGGVGISFGKVLRVKGTGGEKRALVAEGQIGLAPGDSVRFHRADDSDRKAHKLSFIESADDVKGLALKESNESKNPSEKHLWISMPEGFDAGDSVYLIQTRTMSKRYMPVIPQNLDAFKRTPGRDQAPRLELALPAGKGRSAQGKQPVSKRQMREQVPFLTEGLYPSVSRIEDLYIVQAANPAGVMLALSRNTAAVLLADKKPLLPFPPSGIILVLDPFLPEARDAVLAEQIPALMERGFRQFVVNNPGHFSYFRPSPHTPLLIAGPYLYVFNRWANAFVSGLGAGYFVSPLENNRQNLERTAETRRRKFVFVTVFAYPALFRIRAGLDGRYSFGAFQDSQDEQFHLVSGSDGSIVYPEKPFSITDKIPFLREAGFGRFILDLTGPPLKQAAFRDLLDELNKGTALLGGVRFNWKDGFFHLEEGSAAHKPPLKG